MKWGNTQLQITFLHSISCSSKLVCPCFFYLTGTWKMFPISQIHCHIFKSPLWFVLLFHYLPTTCRSTFLKAHKAKNLPMMYSSRNEERGH